MSLKEKYLAALHKIMDSKEDGKRGSSVAMTEPGAEPTPTPTPTPEPEKKKGPGKMLGGKNAIDAYAEIDK